MRGSMKLKLTPGGEFAILAAAYLALAVVAFGGIPDDATIYWAGSPDQSHYLASTHAFAQLDLSAARHWYPFGYSLAMVPLAFLPAWLGFLVLGLVCLFGAWRGFRAIAGRFDVAAPLALAVFVATTLVQPLIGVEWITPWSTTLSACLLFQAAARTLAFAERNDRTAGMVLGVLLASIAATRPTDVVVSLMLGAYALIMVRARPGRIVPVLAGGALVSAAYLALHLAIYGPVASEYMKMSQGHGFNFAQLGWKAYLILVEPRPWYPSGQGLLRACPWLMLGAAGMVAALLPGQARRGQAAVLVAICVAYLALMLAYVDLLPSGLWTFHNVHYFKWLLPLFGLFALLFLRRLVQRPVPMLAVLAALVFVTAFRFTPEPVADGQPARALLLPAVVNEPGGDPVVPGAVYFARSVIRDRAGDLRNFFEYHQVARPDGRVVAVALRQDFAGGERWEDEGVTAAGWPRGMPGEEVRIAFDGPWPRSPEARYAPRVEIGVPCWLPYYHCPAELP